MKLDLTALAERALALRETLGRIPTAAEFVSRTGTSTSTIHKYGGWSAVAEAAFGDDYVPRPQARAGAKAPEVRFERAGKELAPYQEADTFVFTCAQNDTAPEADFLAALESYVEARDGVLGVIPVRYKNPTQRSDPSGEADGLTWHESLRPYLIENDLRITPDLVVLGGVRIQATSPNPLSGMGGRSKGSSAIFGHPKLMMETIATPQNRLPKILYTTGSVTEKNYSSTKLGDLAAFHHMHSAIVVERENDRFWIRSIIWDGECFYDMEDRWTAEGFDGQHRVEALNTGDEHERYHDPVVRAVTYDNPDSICKVLRPKRVFRHDSFDGDTVNHHDQKNTIVKAVKAGANRSSLRDELDAWVNYLRDTRPEDCENVIVKSNHDERLVRWLQGSDANVDPENLLLYYELKAELLRSAKMGPGGVEHPDPLEMYAKWRGLEHTTFLARDDSYIVCGIENGLHGDEGSNGARGSARGFAQIGVRTNTAHTHAPRIFEGNWCAGMSCYPRLSYNRRGPSSWLQTHIVTHANGRRQMIHILNGRWRR